MRGPLSGVPFSGAPSGVGRRSPVPPIVSMIAGAQVHGSNSMVADVADHQAVVRPDVDAVGLPQLGLRGRAEVAREPGDSGPGERRDDARRAVDLSHDVAVALGDIHVAARVEDDLVGHVQRARRGRAAVAAVGPLTVAGDRSRRAGCEVEAADTLVVDDRRNTARRRAR